MHRWLTTLRRGFNERIGWKRLGIAASLLIIGIAITTLVHMLRGVDTGVVLVALAVVFAVSGLGTDKKVRVFNSRYEAVWSAATEVAKDAFLPDRASKEEGKLRFRAGPFRGYRFEVFIVDAGSGKTRVELELRTNLRGIEKDAWRNGDRYLGLLAQKLQRGSGK